MPAKLYVVFAAVVTLSIAQPDARWTVAERVTTLTRESAWKPVASVPVDFPTYHPQGMARIGDMFYVSSVEIKVPTILFPKPVDGYDRDPGQGIGHLFKIHKSGNLPADL